MSELLTSGSVGGGGQPLPLPGSHHRLRALNQPSPIQYEIKGYQESPAMLALDCYESPAPAFDQFTALPRIKLTRLHRKVSGVQRRHFMVVKAGWKAPSAV
jgi:hypothetical protein